LGGENAIRSLNFGDVEDDDEEEKFLVPFILLFGNQYPPLLPVSISLFCSFSFWHQNL